MNIDDVKMLELKELLELKRLKEMKELLELKELLDLKRMKDSREPQAAQAAQAAQQPAPEPALTEEKVTEIISSEGISAPDDVDHNTKSKSDTFIENLVENIGVPDLPEADEQYENELAQLKAKQTAILNGFFNLYKKYGRTVSMFPISILNIDCSDLNEAQAELTKVFENGRKIKQLALYGQFIQARHRMMVERATLIRDYYNRVNSDSDTHEEQSSD